MAQSLQPDHTANRQACYRLHHCRPRAKRTIFLSGIQSYHCGYGLRRDSWQTLGLFKQNYRTACFGLDDGDRLRCHDTTQSQSASCTITVIPARALDNLYGWEFYKKGVALTFTSNHENSPTLVRLMALYNLTKCEALCALQFIATPSILDIATDSHRSTETVRNHIKSIMKKLDVHNQGALMKKLLAIAAL